MLIYIASYPRSGNTWVRQLIRHYFGYQTASVYAEPQGSEPNLSYRQDGSFDAFSSFELPRQPGVTRLKLVNDCGPILGKNFRQQVAESETCFFLKTHEPPFPTYFRGESVLYLTREPGAVFWSYYNHLLRNQPQVSQHVTMDQVIAGNVPFGSWSKHSQAWLRIGTTLGECFQLCTYEEISQQETAPCDAITLLTGLSYSKNNIPLPPLEHWHKTAPTLYRAEKEAKWQEHYTPRQLQAIYRKHRITMKQLGYNPESYRQPLIARFLLSRYWS